MSKIGLGRYKDGLWLYIINGTQHANFHLGQCLRENGTETLSAQLLRRALDERQPIPLVLAEIMAELHKAMDKFPTWPNDPLHAMGILHEEVGELAKAVLQQMYEPHKNKPGDIRKEALQAAAMAIRFLASLDCYEWACSADHKQDNLTL